MSTCTLAKGGTSITIAAPIFPEVPGESYPMVWGRTSGGGIKTADLASGTDFVQMPLSFRLNNTHFVALRNFIQDTVSWQQDAFTYTDPSSAAFANMHYIEGLPEFSRTNNLWTGVLTIAKDMSA